MSDKTLARIGALLRKAESTDNEHEADAFLKAAQRLATLAAVDLAVARAHTAGSERRTVPTQRTIDIGPAGKRGLRTYVHLFVAIAQANSVTCDVATNSTKVYAYGFESDIETAEALYASLVIQMVRSCDLYLASAEHRGERVRELEMTGFRPRVVERKVHGTTARINFQQAFAARIGKRLAEARARAQQEAIDRAAGPPADDRVTGGATDGRPAQSVEIVLRAREAELAEHYRSHSGARGSWGGFRATTTRSEASRRAGDRAGRSARLGGEKAIGGVQPSLGRAAR